jgi:hypothetical protein
MKARNETAFSAVHVVTGGRLFWALSLSTVLALCGIVKAQPDVNLPGSSGRTSPAAGLTAITPTTTTAEVTGTDVNVRSGPNTNFYPCGKLNKGDRIQVARVQNGWSAIVPPPGSYSWINVQYVSVSVQNATEGIVTGDGVPVYAGSDDLDPLVSTSKQDVTMSRGQKVRLLGEDKQEYYKIAPPAGAYLWVNNQFLQFVQGPGPGVSLAGASRGGAQPLVKPGATPPATEAGLMSEYSALVVAIDAEKKKPLAEQDYTAIREKLKTLAANKEGGRAARYAQYRLKQVNGYDLARTAGKELELQNQDLQTTSEKIAEALKEQLIKIGDPAKYIVKGKLQPSALYAAVVGQPRRYQVVDESGRIVCYAAPAGTAAGKDLAPFIGHVVGLVGQIQPQAATSKPFVEFSDIVRLDQN